MPRIFTVFFSIGRATDLVSARPDMADVGGGVLVYVFAVVGFKGSCDGGVVALDPMRL